MMMLTVVMAAAIAYFVLGFCYVMLGMHYMHEAGISSVGGQTTPAAAATGEVEVRIPTETDNADGLPRLGDHLGSVEVTPLALPQTQGSVPPHRSQQHPSRGHNGKKRGSHVQKAKSPIAAAKFEAGEWVTDGNNASCESDNKPLSPS